jgi:hypothetical protein
MSFYDPAGLGPPPFKAPPRPRVVTVAGMMLFACVLLAVAGGIAAIAAGHTVTANLNAEDATSDDVNTGRTLMAVYAGASLVVAVTLGLCGMFILRGRRAMRIVTWVIAGLGVLCLSCSAIGSGGDALISSGSITSSADETLIHAIPGWYYATSSSLEGVTILLLILVIIFIALPSANAYFRTPASLVYPGYPGYPGYQGASGYPGAGYPGTGYPGAGYPGAAGYPGGPGYPGAPGYPGYQDYSGAPGNPGAAGYPGAPGNPGAPGYPSAPGNPGYTVPVAAYPAYPAYPPSDTPWTPPPPPVPPTDPATSPPPGPATWPLPAPATLPEGQTVEPSTSDSPAPTTPSDARDDDDWRRS